MKNTAIRIMLVAAALILCLTLAACSDNEGEIPSGWKEASTDKCDFNFYVPESWTVEFSTAAVSAYFSERDPSNVSVMAWQLDAGVTNVDAWWEMNKTDVELVFSELELLSTENTTVDEVYGKSFTYTAKLGENKYKITQTAVIKRGSVYVITYTSTEEFFDKHTEEVSSMLEYMTIE